MKLLKQLYKTHSPSGKEWTMIKFIRNYIKTIPGVSMKKDNWDNLYITKGKAEHYPCIVAHLDQVQWTHSRDFTPIETKDIIFGYSPSKRRQEGLGADDKNGIWIALRCLEKYDTLKLAFFTGEEIGCIGSSNAVLEFFDDTRFVIQPDRRGFEDIISSIGRVSLCSKEFIRDIHPEKFGYKETDGMMTDILALKERGLTVSCVNISCGYYEPHSDQEFTVKKDLLNCLKQIEYIIENCNRVYPHQTGKDKFFNEWEMINQDYDEAADELFQILDMNPMLDADDLFDMYQTNFPNLDKTDFERIYNTYFEIETDEEFEPGFQELELPDFFKF